LPFAGQRALPAFFDHRKLVLAANKHARVSSSPGFEQCRMGEFAGNDERIHLTVKPTATVTTCGRICNKRRKINLSTVFAAQKVSVKQVSDKIWLVSFMQYDPGYFDHETCRLEPIANPFAAKVLPMSPV